MATRAAWVSFDEIGRDCLIASAEAGADIVAIITLPADVDPKPSGWCSFDDVATSTGAALIPTRDVNSPGTLQAVSAATPDMIFVVGWSQLVREAFIRIPPRGVFGMHPTLLPKHRGRAPVPWAILSGLAATGVTLFEIVDDTADSGLVVGQVEVPIDHDETATTLYAKVADAHLELIRTCVPLMLAGTASREPQDPRRASEWPRRRPGDGLIDWNMRASYVDAWVRAQTRPYPGAFTFVDDAKVTVWRARPAEGDGPAGRVIGTRVEGVVVACGEGAVVLEEVDVDGVGLLKGPRIGAHLAEGVVLG